MPLIVVYEPVKPSNPYYDILIQKPKRVGVVCHFPLASAENIVLLGLGVYPSAISFGCQVIEPKFSKRGKGGGDETTCHRLSRRMDIL